MAQIGSGNGSHYPGAIDTKQSWRNALAAAPDSDTRLDSEAFNDFATAIVQIETAPRRQSSGDLWFHGGTAQSVSPGAGVSPAYVTFNNATILTIPGTVHRLGTSTLLFQVYDASIPAMAVSPNEFTVLISPNSYDVTLTFAQPQSGLVVLSAGCAALFHDV